jgi:GAF domain-containing protein
MGRRVRGGGEAVKTRRRRKVTPKRRVPEVASHRRSSAVARKTSVASLTTELHGALEQQAATAEVLRIIASSHGELAPVFDAILANATRLCEAKFGILWLREGDLFRSVALNNAPIALAELRRREPLVRAEPGNALGRVVATRQTVHVDDIMAEPAYAKRDPLRVATVELAGARTLVAVPMVMADDLIGALVIYRREVRRFTDKQIELVTSFANQAVIAIENARLLRDLSQRTADLGESLQHQTATSAVLQVISSSPGELKPVFQTILENATRLCAGKFGQLFLYEGGNAYRAVALYNAPPAWAEALMRAPVIRPPPDVPLGRIAVTKQVTYLADIKATPSYVERNPFVFGAVELGGYRSVLVVPILKDNDLIGSINIMHQEVQPFTDNQIELVKSFAAQAVIAIENARLLNDLRQRTADLSESLQHQTATSEVLRVISAARGELGPTFKAILENATRICEASFGIFHLYDEKRSPPPSAWASRRHSKNICGAGRIARREKPRSVRSLVPGRRSTSPTFEPARRSRAVTPCVLQP